MAHHLSDVETNSRSRAATLTSQNNTRSARLSYTFHEGAGGRRPLPINWYPKRFTTFFYGVGAADPVTYGVTSAPAEEAK